MNKEDLRFAVLATDTVLFTFNKGKLLVRLIKIDKPPFFIKTKGLPGGLIDPKETAEDASKRVVEEKAGISAAKLYLEQLYTFSSVDRDPRGRVVAVAYLALVPFDKLSIEEQGDFTDSFWSPVATARGLAYDHDEILHTALTRLRSRATYTTVLSKLLTKEFTLSDLENIYEAILGKELDKRNFRKKIHKLNIIEPVKGKFHQGKFRPAQIYHFSSKEVKEIQVL